MFVNVGHRRHRFTRNSRKYLTILCLKCVSGKPWFEGPSASPQPAIKNWVAVLNWGRGEVVGAMGEMGMSLRSWVQDIDSLPLGNWMLSPCCWNKAPPLLDTIPKIVTNPARALLTLSRSHLYTHSEEMGSNRKHRHTERLRTLLAEDTTPL